jgi:hypothetical protein
MSKEKTTTPAIFSELLAAQTTRDELMKWKLIVVSALGAAGLGFIENKTLFDLHLIIAIIPFACVYIDLLCRNLSVRTKRINHFITTLSNDESIEIDIKYAQFYQDIKKLSGQSLESYALIWSTILISIIVSLIGIIRKDSYFVQLLFISSGLLSIVLSWLVERRYKFEKETLKVEKS